MRKENSNIFLFGLNHETAPIGLREKFALDPSRVLDVALNLQNDANAREVLVLSTCNRTEIYYSAEEPRAVINWLLGEQCFNAHGVEDYFYLYTGIAVFEHAARVASGLDSMVLGETQIHGQLKRAYFDADKHSTLGANLYKLFQTVFSVAKNVRSNTGVGAETVSLASAVMAISRAIFPNILERSVLFIGAGEMVRLCAEHISTNKFQRLAFANRSSERGAILAKSFNGDFFPLEKIPNILSKFDIVISCTGSLVPLIGKGAVENAIRVRKHEPIAIFDLAVPRDIEENVSELDDVFLYSIDDIGAYTDIGRSKREASIAEAERIIKEGADLFSSWVNARKNIDALKSFRKFGADIVDRELSKAIQSLKRGKSPEIVIEQFSESIKNKFLDRPSRALTQHDAKQQDYLSSALLNLFNLDDQI